MDFSAMSCTRPADPILEPLSSTWSSQEKISKEMSIIPTIFIRTLSDRINNILDFPVEISESQQLEYSD